MITTSGIRMYGIIITFALATNMVSVNGMKRSSTDTQEEHLATFPIERLPIEILQKIFGILPYKLPFLTICKDWYNLWNFAHWKCFIGTEHIARTLQLTPDARIRIYRLLLTDKTKGAEADLNSMLSRDPNREKHMAEVATLTYTPLSMLVSDENILKILAVYGIAIDHIKVTDLAGKNPIRLSKEQISKLPAHAHHIAQLCDIVLRNDQQQLATFLNSQKTQELFTDAVDIADDGDNDAYLEVNFDFEMDFIIESDVLLRFCSPDTIEKLLPLLQHIYQYNEERVPTYSFCDYLLYRALCGPIRRLDIARLLLKNGAKYFFEHAIGNPVNRATCIDIVKNQDLEALTLVAKHGFNIEVYRDRKEGYRSDDFEILCQRSKRLILCNDSRIARDGEPCFVGPLMYSVYLQKSPEFIKKLIEIGADPFEVNNLEWWLGDVLELANRLGNPEIIQVIEEARAQIKN